MDFVQEMRWRGLLQDIMPDTEAYLKNNKTTGYIGFDPTADSLHVGSFQQIMILSRLQKAGHKPIALMGGATGMIGDPTGKSAERELLSLDLIQHNLEGQKKQLSKFIDFDKGSNGGTLVNNYDWFKNISFLDFIRDVGKHITVNYMLAKDSVQNRLENGLSFTEFSYQLVQGYDFLHLYRHHDCKLQLGGSDQWGNIVAGTELIRRIDNGKAYAITSPLVTRADGSKFGKSASGEQIWLDPAKTSPYKFYQFFLNRADDEVMNLLMRFTWHSEEALKALEAEHILAPHLRILQKELAKEMTIMVHSQADYNRAIEASNILFGNASIDEMKQLSSSEILDIFDGVPQHTCSLSALESGVDIVSFLTQTTNIQSSNNEARRSVSDNAVSINKQKVTGDKVITKDDLLNNQYVLVQIGKKKYFLVVAA